VIESLFWLRIKGQFDVYLNSQFTNCKDWKNKRLDGLTNNSSGPQIKHRDLIYPFVYRKVIFFKKIIFLESEFLESELLSDVW
jgi:hypothetical protein